jgi:hypothetical protein
MSHIFGVIVSIPTNNLLIFFNKIKEAKNYKISSKDQWCLYKLPRKDIQNGIVAILGDGVMNPNASKPYDVSGFHNIGKQNPIMCSRVLNMHHMNLTESELYS